MANQPDIIPMAWAENNSTVSSIPETTSESGKASWDQGFPVETSLPLSQGGVPPKYGDFNGILKVLSQFAVYAQQGGQFAWNRGFSYGVGSIVLGTDGSLYRAAQASRAVNPVSDTSGKWESLSNLVHKSGNESISGVKTFSSDIVTSNGILRKATNTGRLHLCGGTGTDQEAGARIALVGSAESSVPGAFYLLAQNVSASVYMRGLPDGSLIWNGQPIQTSSDERLKADFAIVPDGVLDAWESVQWQEFRYIAAKEAKGEEARKHTGLVAQRVKAAFEDMGLDACEYGILCHEEWQDEYDEQGRLILAAGEVWTIRYEEALAMEAAYQRRRAERAEGRISALERRLAELEAALASLITPDGETYAQDEEE